MAVYSDFGSRNRLTNVQPREQPIQSIRWSSGPGQNPRSVLPKWIIKAMVVSYIQNKAVIFRHLLYSVQVHVKHSKPSHASNMVHINTFNTRLVMTRVRGQVHRTIESYNQREHAWLTKCNWRNPAAGHLVSSGGRSRVHHSSALSRKTLLSPASQILWHFWWSCGLARLLRSSENGNIRAPHG